MTTKVFIKIKDIIESCRTKEQLRIAEKILHLSQKDELLSPEQIDSLSDTFFAKEYEIIYVEGKETTSGCHSTEIPDEGRCRI